MYVLYVYVYIFANNGLAGEFASQALREELGVGVESSMEEEESDSLEECSGSDSDSSFDGNEPNRRQKASKFCGLALF